MITPDDQVREKIDAGLCAAGWVIQDPTDADLSALHGIAIRAFPLDRGYGFADYLLCLEGKAAGVIEAKKAGSTLLGVEVPSEKYRRGLPLRLHLFTRPLPFFYQSIGDETCFTNFFDPEPRSRAVFTLHRPETLLGWLEEGMIEPTTRDMVAEASTEYGARGRTFHERMQINMPPLALEGLSSAQIQVIRSLEQSLREGSPRALIRMPGESGKTHTALHFIYRLIKFAEVRRVLILVNGGNLSDQVLLAFQGYVSPYNHLRFIEEVDVRCINSNILDPLSRVCISTTKQISAILRGKELAEENNDPLEPLAYNPSIPIETFDVIVTDECHPSTDKRVSQVLKYFDATLIGLTAAPDQGTINFFNGNLLVGHGQEKDGSDGLNVVSEIG